MTGGHGKTASDTASKANVAASVARVSAFVFQRRDTWLM